jgi:methylglutaconyl-CoA hydratase
VPNRTRDFLSTLRATLSSITALQIPTISAINGSALGGGLELALTTTFRVAASTAKLGLPETRLAIIPGGGGTHRLAQLIGRQRAMYMVLTGRAISAHEAEQMGLCDRMIMAGGVEQAREGVLQEAKGLAEEILRGGPVAIGQALKAVRGFQDHGISEEKGYEVTLQTEDRLAALKAFREKGIAKYQGR